ncbi:TetR/AcrR family transcriptional regulator [Chthonobacter rhizosphaerae]|uniref:TetR/AcrR family transcriptional regulator n=1 Tax=Chthonobacter rhizosphaerae TaxID=2735553 RepID=UPI001FE99915|nr:TetR/AcrR family transcriptional regulator [Chthonobacter rhizosphaerae]
MSIMPLSATPSPTGATSLQDERRNQILEAARVCFARSGFHGASMGQICAEARMSPGALYRYFPSKDAIIEAIAEDERERAKSTMSVFAVPGTLVDRITNVGMEYLRSSRTSLCGGLMVEVCSESIRNSSIGDRFHQIEEDVRTTFVSALRASQAAGEIDAQIDVETTVMVLLSIGDGLMLRLQLEPETDIDKLEPYLRRLVEGLLLARPDRSMPDHRPVTGPDRSKSEQRA